MELLNWDIYEISSLNSIHGVKLRGTIRRFCIENRINCLVENATDKENCVRFALLSGEDFSKVRKHLCKMIDNLEIVLILSSITNPVLSKIKVNDTDRY